MRRRLIAELALAAHSVLAIDDSCEGAGGGDAPARWRIDCAIPASRLLARRAIVSIRGVNHDLTAMSDDACQACHREQFRQLCRGHPEFGEWPYERRTRIAFDHASHQLKHFPAEKRDVRLRRVPSGRRHRRAAAYARATRRVVRRATTRRSRRAWPRACRCCRCRRSTSKRWPTRGTTLRRGRRRRPAISRVPRRCRRALLLAADPQAAAALQALGPQFDFYDVDPDDAEQLAAAAGVARAVRALADELADRGQAAIGERLSDGAGSRGYRGGT